MWTNKGGLELVSRTKVTRQMMDNNTVYHAELCTTRADG